MVVDSAAETGIKPTFVGQAALPMPIHIRVIALRNAQANKRSTSYVSDSSMVDMKAIA